MICLYVYLAGVVLFDLWVAWILWSERPPQIGEKLIAGVALGLFWFAVLLWLLWTLRGLRRVR